MKILHFSDLHLQAELPHGVSWLFDKRLLGTITQRLRRARTQNLDTIPKLLQLATALRPDAILCTGDLTTIAQPDEFQCAMELLAPLRQLVPPERFLFVPGNHDAYIDRPESNAALKKVNDQLNSQLNDIDFQPFQRKLDNVDFVFLNAARPRPPWNSGGVVTARQLTQLAQLLKRPRNGCDARIIISHFPVYTQTGARLSFRRRMTCDMEIRELLEQHVADALLCGHIHHPFVYQRPDFMQVCAGSLTIGHHVALIDVEPHRIHTQFIDIVTDRKQDFYATFHS